MVTVYALAFIPGDNGRVLWDDLREGYMLAHDYLMLMSSTHFSNAANAVFFIEAKYLHLLPNFASGIQHGMEVLLDSCQHL
jgi:hypothetical protein